MLQETHSLHIAPSGPGRAIRTVEQLRAVGWSDGELRRAVDTGRLVRLRRGRYGIAEALPPWEGHARLARAVLDSTGAGVALSHESGAEHLGLAVSPQRLDRVHLTRLDAGHGKTIRGVVHHAAALPSVDTVLVNGVRVTSPARTAVDLARSAPYAWGVAAVRAPGWVSALVQDGRLSGGGDTVPRTASQAGEVGVQLVGWRHGIRRRTVRRVRRARPQHPSARHQLDGGRR